MEEAELRRRLAPFDLLFAPGHLLRRNHQRSFEIFAKHVGDDMTRQQAALLIALAQHGGASQRDLVDATGIDKSTLKEMLARMVSRGWVTRDRDPEDNRAWKLRIAPAGVHLIAERMDAIERAQREILSPLNESERETFIHCLRVLIGLNEDAPSPPQT